MAKLLGVQLTQEEEIVITRIIIDMADGRKVEETDVLHKLIEIAGRMV